LVGTTDDPCDDLSFHKQIKDSNCKAQVLPTFRPDQVFNIGDRANFLKYIGELEKASGIKIYNISDLLAALESGQVSFAGLDVFEKEPPVNMAILEHPNVSLSPHVGGSTKEAQNRISLELADKVIEFFSK
jgi:hypothetical protein